MTQDHQNRRVAYQGFPGAYSDLASRAACPGAQSVPCVDFDDAFRALTDGRADLAMIPVDNSLAGRVADVHRLIPREGHFIIGEHFLPIRHALLGVRGAKITDIRHVHSHIHAIPQCRALIERLGVQAHVAGDTAGAAASIAQNGDKAHAAIASSHAAAIYGLDVLAEDVQDEDHNTTRFLIFARQPGDFAYDKTRPAMTSMIFRVRNLPAALFKALGGFATNGLNLTKLESYVDEHFQAAQFFCEVDGHQNAPAFALAWEELNFYAKDARILGSYPAHPFRHAQINQT